MLAFPVAMAVVLVVLTVALGRAYARRRGPHQAAWTVALAVGAVGTLAYIGCVLAGGDPALFKVYYVAGALLTAPLLGLGSMYLLPRVRWARVYLGVTVVGGALGTVGIVGQPLDRAALQALDFGPGAGLVHAPLALVPLVVLNTLGTVAVAGVGVWSLVGALRRQRPWPFVAGNALIVVATLLIAAAGSMARLDHGRGFWAGMTVGWAVLYVGVLVMGAYHPSAVRGRASEAPSAPRPA